VTSRQLRRLHEAIAVVCPIIGVNDAAPAWFTAKPEATGAEVAAGNAVLAAFDPNDDAALAAWDARQRGFPPNVKAVLTKLQAGTATLADVNAILAALIKREIQKVTA